MTIESGLDGWLRYAPLPTEICNNHRRYSNIIVSSNLETSPIHTAAKELQDGLHRMLNQKVDLSFELSKTPSSSVIVSTVRAFALAGGNTKEVPDLKEDGFWLNTHAENDCVHILGQSERGALYGAFEYLMRLAQGNLAPVAAASNPSAPIRWVNQWDNLDGSIERGYAGPSIFFRGGEVVEDMTRIAQFARLLSSVRLNAVVVNNVNANPKLFSETNLNGLRRIADTMRPWGIRIGISLYFDSPKEFGGLATSDPLDPAVNEWWKEITSKVYKMVPDLVGYTIKANSEGQPGPLTYQRTLADGANMFARALKPYGDSVVMYRAFVYDHHLDESVWTNDRANAAVDYFKHLDGEFEENVIVQIKWGPIDFQVREPPSPLLANLRKTKAAIEFQVAQEYLGQQSHFVYMAPLWKEILDYDMRIDGKPSAIRDIISGERLDWSRSGYTAVLNIGSDTTWIGHHLSLSNLYAYGRMSWAPSTDPVSIIEDWTRLTFSLNKTVVETITKLSMDSWPTYENYSGNLGIQTLCDIIDCHYGPSPGSQDGNGWGQWTRANAHSIGMDRTVATGSANTGQYPPEVAAIYENIETTPDNLLLWFHHVPYTHRLKSGKTVIQHFYDAHYEGAAHAQNFVTEWVKLRGLIDDHRFEDVAFKLQYQAGHALVWRDSVNNFYFAKCNIADEKNRVGNHVFRIEAEDMQLFGYKVVQVTPAEAASGGKAIITESNKRHGTAQTELSFPSGIYDIAVNYYDHLGGKSKYEIFLRDKSIGTWRGDLEDELGHAFSGRLDGHSATRMYFRGVEVKCGDVLKIVGWPDGTEFAPLDYVSVLPQGTID
jgi:alpha-glucuronidase